MLPLFIIRIQSSSNLGIRISPTALGISIGALEPSRSNIIITRVIAFLVVNVAATPDDLLMAAYPLVGRIASSAALSLETLLALNSHQYAQFSQAPQVESAK